MTLDIANFYLMTPIKDYEYLRMKLSSIPEEIIKECNIESIAHNGWVCAEIRSGTYELPQARMLAKELLQQRLEKAGYYQVATTPGLWRHTWRPIMFALVVDDFGVECVDQEHAQHLIITLQENYEITADCAGTKFLGIDLEWNYSDHTVRLSMKNYIIDVLKRFQHKLSAKPHHAPHHHNKPTYGSNVQYPPDPDASKLRNKQ